MIEITEQDYKNILKKNKLPKKLLNQGITIVMPKSEANTWLKALHSEKFAQIEGSLYDPDIDGYCCLGLQQKCATNMIEYTEDQWNNDAPVTLKSIDWIRNEQLDNPAGGARGLPTIKYLRSRGIFYANPSGYRTDNPYIPTENDTVGDLNDSGYSFKEIANLMKKHMAVY